MEIKIKKDEALRAMAEIQKIFGKMPRATIEEVDFVKLAEVKKIPRYSIVGMIVILKALKEKDEDHVFDIQKMKKIVLTRKYGEWEIKIIMDDNAELILKTDHPKELKMN